MHDVTLYKAIIISGERALKIIKIQHQIQSWCYCKWLDTLLIPHGKLLNEPTHLGYVISSQSCDCSDKINLRWTFILMLEWINDPPRLSCEKQVLAWSCWMAQWAVSSSQTLYSQLIIHLITPWIILPYGLQLFGSLICNNRNNIQHGSIHQYILLLLSLMY